MGIMRDNGRASDVAWAPLRESYEEAVLNWYEQIESSFRRRRLEANKSQAEVKPRREVLVTTGQAAFD